MKQFKTDNILEMMFKGMIILCVFLTARPYQIQAEDSNHPALPYHTLPVYGNASLGYYYVKIYLGSPETQPQSVIVDTGSGILAVPCTKCRGCSKHHIDPPYDPEKSTYSSFLTCQSKNRHCEQQCLKIIDKTQSCPFSIHYAEGSSLLGIMVEDKIAFESYSHGEQITTFFGCTTKQTNLFLSQEANGIFGLAPKRQSDLLEQMVARHSMYSGQTLQFSLCLSSNGGLMTIGGINHELHGGNEEPSFVAEYSSFKNLYSLQGMSEVRIGSEILHWGTNYGTYGIFIDSGATFTYFPRDKYQKFQKYLNNLCIDSKKCSLARGEDSMCYKLETQQKSLLEATSDLFPPLFFQLNRKDLAWPATKYMLVRSEKNSEVCLGVLSLDRFLLGANWMYDRDIVFNLKDSTVSIYNDVKCLKNAPEMGKYTKNELENSQLNFQTQIPLGWSASQVLFFIGVIFTILSLLGIVSLLIFKQGDKKTSTTQQAQEQNIVQNETQEEDLSAGHEQKNPLYSRYSE